MAQLPNSKEINNTDSKLTKEISDRLQILFDSICHDILLKLDLSIYDIEAKINKSWPTFDQKFEPVFNITKTLALKYLQSFLDQSKSTLPLTLDLDIFEQNCNEYKGLIAKWTNNLYHLKNYFLCSSMEEISKSIIDKFNLSGDEFELIIDENNTFSAKSLQSNESTSLKSNHAKIKELEERISKAVSELEERLLFGFKLGEKPASLTNAKCVHRDAREIAIYEELGKKNICIYEQTMPNKNPNFIKKLFNPASQEDIDKICQLEGTLLIKSQDSESTTLIHDPFNTGFYIINKDLSFVELLCIDKGFSYKSEYLRNLPTDNITQSSSSPDIKIKSKLQLALREHISSSIIKESLSNTDHELPYIDLTYPYSEIPNRSKEDAQPKLKLSDTFYELEAKCSSSNIYNSQYIPIPTTESFTTTPSTKRKIPVDYMANVDQAPSKQPKLNDSATSKPNCARIINFTDMRGPQDTEKLAESNSKIIELLLQKKPDHSKLTENCEEERSIEALYFNSTDHKPSTQTKDKIDKTWISESWESNEDEMTINQIIDDN